MGPLLKAFMDFWDAQDRKAAAKGAAIQVPNWAAAVSPSEPPADSSAGAEEQPSRAEAGGPAANGGCKAGEDGVLSQQGEGRAADVAADVVEGATSKKPHSQGRYSLALIPAHQDICRLAIQTQRETTLHVATCTLAKGDTLAASHDGVACLAAGQSMPLQDKHEPKFIMTEAEKAERRRVKKARQRAARAKPAAQTAEV